MMNQPDDGFHSQANDLLQLFFGPAPIDIFMFILDVFLPKHRVSYLLYTKAGDLFQIVRPFVMSGVFELITKIVSYPVYRALKTSPDFRQTG